MSGKRLGEKDTTKAIYISKVIIWLELKARDDFWKFIADFIESV